MTEKEIKNLIQQQLPQLIVEDPQIRDFILRTVSEYYSPKQETESKFELILTELQKDREEQTRKWEEQNRRLDNFIHEQNHKWEEQNQYNKAILEEIQRLDKRFDSTIGALGSRWSLYSEASFRNGLKGILENSFGVEVVNVNEFDDQGEVFGRPDQVEIDVIVKNGILILCEIKSNIDKAGIYIFDRKVSFYEKRHQRKVNRKLVICPMVDERAKPVAKKLGIEVYSYADNMKLE
jgi:hypothetical protein